MFTFAAYSGEIARIPRCSFGLGAEGADAGEPSGRTSHSLLQPRRDSKWLRAGETWLTCGPLAAKIRSLCGANRSNPGVFVHAGLSASVFLCVRLLRRASGEHRSKSNSEACPDGQQGRQAVRSAGVRLQCLLISSPLESRESWKREGASRNRGAIDSTKFVGGIPKHPTGQTGNVICWLTPLVVRRVPFR